MFFSAGADALPAEMQYRLLKKKKKKPALSFIIRLHN